MQSHLVEKASESAEDIRLHIETTSSKDGEEDEWEIKYEHVASYFDKGKGAPHKVTILQDNFEDAPHKVTIPQDNLEDARFKRAWRSLLR